MSTTSDATATTTGTYSIDPTHSRIGFVARHAMVTKVRGSFNEIEGSGHFDAADPTQSSLAVTIQTASVDTRNEDRDNHLRTGDFFEAEAFPTITFASTGVEAVDADAGEYRIVGDLTIKDVTKPISIDAELAGSAVDPFGHTRLGLEGSTVISRKDWGLTYNAALEAGGVLISDKITLEFEVSAVRNDG
ncbi:MAG: YceI family protein [Acidimicrobiales bacterium]